MVFVGLPVVAQVGIRNRLCFLVMEVVRSLLEEDMVAANTDGRNNQIGAEGRETDEQGVIWCWMSTSRS